MDTGWTTVETPKGWLRGGHTARLRYFRGLHFGAAPVGELRWRPPQPVAPWGGVRDATRFGPACPQLRPSPVVGPNVDLFAGMGPMSEGCLTLNLTMPRHPPSGRTPVLIWFHGGSFLHGAASLPIWDAKRLVADARVAVVTPNYRLGSLGFLDLDPRRRNAGVHDALAALHWVYENGDAFGLDLNTVTVGGSSAGAALAGIVATSPHGAGRVRRVIGQSGLGVTPLTAEQAATRTATFLDALVQQGHAGDPEQARVEDLLDAQEHVDRTLERRPGELAFAPVEEEGIVEIPHLAVGNPTGPLDVLGGTTGDEMFLYGERHTSAVREPAWELLDRPLERFLRAAEHNGRVYAYRFDLPSEIDHLRACHGVDVPFIFGRPDTLGPFPPKDTPSRRKLARSLRRSWGRFVEDGVPDAVLDVAHPEWRPPDRARLVVDDDPWLLLGTPCSEGEPT